MMLEQADINNSEYATEGAAYSASELVALKSVFERRAHKHKGSDQHKHDLLSEEDDNKHICQELLGDELSTLNIASIGINLGDFLAKLVKSIFSPDQEDAIKLIQLIPPMLQISIQLDHNEDILYNLRELIFLKLSEIALSKNDMTDQGEIEKPAIEFLNTYFDCISQKDASFIDNIEKVKYAFSSI